jgi:hypothetical protein
MAYIFLDESGDLGFNKRSSKWFLFTMVIIDDHRKLERITKKVWKSLRKKHKHIGELHASKEKDVTRYKLLKQVAGTTDIKIMSLILDKKKVYLDLEHQKHYLYTLTANMLLEKLHTNQIADSTDVINIIIDRKDTKKMLRENFINDLTGNFRKKYDGEFKISLEGSHENKSLQVADFISWALFQKYEHGNYEFYEIIKNNIVEEFLLFP